MTDLHGRKIGSPERERDRREDRRLRKVVQGDGNGTFFRHGFLELVQDLHRVDNHRVEKRSNLGDRKHAVAQREEFGREAALNGRLGDTEDRWHDVNPDGGESESSRVLVDGGYILRDSQELWVSTSWKGQDAGDMTDRHGRGIVVPLSCRLDSEQVSVILSLIHVYQQRHT